MKALKRSIVLLLLTLPTTAQQPDRRMRAEETTGPQLVDANAQNKTTAPLPAPAQKILDRLQAYNSAAQTEYERQIQRQREAATSELQTLADLYAATDRPTEAAAIQQQIRSLNAQQPELHGPVNPRRALVPPAQDAPVPATANFVPFRSLVGQSFPLVVTGTTTGTVWGSDIYTDDSSPGAAAVHAGLVKPGEQRAVMVKFLKGQDEYAASTRNGVTTTAYKSWDGSFSLEALPAIQGTGQGPVPFLDTPNGLIAALRGHEGAIIFAQVTGETTGSIWGNQIYTDDSPVAVAAVHAGVLKSGQTAIVKIAVRAPRQSYEGTEQNGIPSRPYGPYSGSYEILNTPAPAADPAPGAPKAALPRLDELEVKQTPK